MARNEEKAQSMLYRFREAQAAELGLGTRSDRRPRMASTCKSLRDCERWRGEILREISRKVSKIQDSGLTDYECRDLNDEINKLMREKRHWENQIVALGGANYRRNVAMMDDDGKEVPGTKGYKYFGRAKELPGVKELFMSKKKEEDAENQAQAFYKKFTNQGPAYFGDLDEADGKLVEFELQAEDEEWDDAYTHLRQALGLPADEPIPKMPRPTPTASATLADQTDPQSGADSKRKAPDAETDGEDVTMATEAEAEPSSKKRPKAKGKAKGKKGKAAKTTADAPSADAVPAPPPAPAAAAPEEETAALVHARATAAYIPFLTAEQLLPPAMPTHKEMEGFLLELRKRALVEEYFGESQAQTAQ